MGIIIIIGGCVIAILISLVIFLSIKLHQYKKGRNDSEILEKSQLIILPNKYVPKTQVPNIAIPVPQQMNTKPKADYELLSNYSKRNDGNQDSPNVFREYFQKDLLSTQKLNETESNLSRTETDLSFNTNGDMDGSILETAYNEVPAIDFKLVYISQELTLKLHINRVSNLPLQFRKNCSSYVKISLITNSEKLSSYNTSVIKKSLNPEYEEDFTFSTFYFEDLNNLTIRISVYAKRKQFSKRQLVGDLWVPLSRPDLEPDVELICNEKLSLACPRTGKRGPLLMAGKLGYLFIQLQYQPEAQRLKVIVRKGQNLLNKSIGYNNFQITKPDYYVIINLHRNNDAIVYKETKPAVGVSPIWNQPFIFDVPEFDTSQYWIQFLVMQGKSYTKDGVVGQVLIGPNTSISGIQHWNDITGPDFRETVKWHPIANIGTHCF